MPQISNYETFEIHIAGRSGNGRQIYVRCPAGEASVPLDERLVQWSRDSGLRLDDRHSGSRRDLVRLRENRLDEESHRTTEEIGRDLYDAVFREQVADLLQASLTSLRTQPRSGLCIRLHFDLADQHQAELARLPWEVLFHPGQEKFLSQSVQTPILRFLKVTGRLPSREVPPRLRILVVISRPHGLPALMDEMESHRIEASWQQDNVQVTVLQCGDQHDEGGMDLGAMLRDRLRRGEFHVVHFIGHGTHDAVTRAGILFFETANGEPMPVSGESFANWLINHSALRLIVLNACNTGQLPETEPFAAVAPALLRSGIPAVLAMQQPMADKMALEFSRVLYSGLADGSALEAALSAARLELHSIPGQATAWATPVLWQRTPELIRVPPRIGAALARFWILLGITHLVFVGLLFLRNLGAELPVLYHLMNETVAAHWSIILGLPVFCLTLYCGREYANAIELPPSAQQTTPMQRLAYRLPEVWRKVIWLRQGGEKIDKVFFLLFFITLPLIFHGWLFVELVDGVVWHRREKEVFLSGWRQNFTTYVPLAESFFGDNFRMGDMKPDMERVTNNVSYHPFWQPWGLLLAELLTLALCGNLLWTLFRPEPAKPEDSS